MLRGTMAAPGKPAEEGLSGEVRAALLAAGATEVGFADLEPLPAEASSPRCAGRGRMHSRTPVVFERFTTRVAPLPRKTVATTRCLWTQRHLARQGAGP
jgi:hypothetical protein